MLVFGSENGLEVVNQSAGKLIWGGGLRAIWVLKVGYMVLPISFDNGVVKKGSIAVTMNSPILFSSLDVVSFLFGKEIVVVMGGLLLQGMILLARMLGLFLQKLIFNGCKLVRISGLTSSPLT